MPRLHAKDATAGNQTALFRQEAVCDENTISDHKRIV
jgi:hypothetical protein